MRRKIIIGLIGASKCSPQIAKIAEEVGKQISLKGAILICGGLGGVMLHAAKGAKSVGGLTIGILPGFAKEESNPYIDIPIVTGLSVARNVILGRTSDVIIAIDGGYGTLSEIGHALNLGIPVVGINTWVLNRDNTVDNKIIRANTPQEAVDLAFKEVIKKHRQDR